MSRRVVTLAFPKGTCSIPPFYFRGENPLTEHEFLTGESVRLQHQLDSLSRDLRGLRQTHEALEHELHLSNDYTVKLACELGEKSLPTTEHVDLIDDLDDLAARRAELQSLLASYGQLSGAIERGRLQREQDSLFLETEELERGAWSHHEANRELRRRLAAEIASERFQRARATEMEREVAAQCARRVRHEIATLTKHLNAAPAVGRRTASANAVARTNDRILRLLDDRTEVNLEVVEVGLKRRLANVHRRSLVKVAFETVERLNEMLIVLRLPYIDLVAVRKNCDIDEIEAQEALSRNRTASGTGLPSGTGTTGKGTPRKGRV
jgi:hypothetical protein